MDVNEIEVVHFERMFYGMKNFDLAIIFKDFSTFTRINSVPTEYTEELKSYFNEIGVIYIESLAPFKWQEILATVREDFPGWLEEGAWSQLVEGEEDGEEEESEDEEDPQCAYGDEEDSEDESDFSDASEEESSDVESEASLSEAGLSWDELDKQAIEDDRKFSTNNRVDPRREAGGQSGRRR